MKTKTLPKKKLFVIILELAIVAVLCFVGWHLVTRFYMPAKLAAGDKVNATTYRILCLGDSMTENSQTTSYPQQLEAILNSKGLSVKFKVLNKGKAGLKTRDIVEGIDRHLMTYNPDMVIAMMGVNDDEGYEDNRAEAMSESLRLHNLTQMVDEHILRKIRELERVKNYPELVRVYEAALKKSPKNIYLIEGLVDAYKAVGQPERSQQLLISFLQKNSRDSNAYYLLGRWYKDQKQLHMHENVFEKGLTLNPDHLGILTEFADYFQANNKNFERAIEMLEKVIEVEPKKIDAYVILGNTYQKLNHFENAKKMYIFALSLNPHQERVIRSLIAIYNAQGNVQRAEHLYKKMMVLRSYRHTHEITKQSYRQLIQAVRSYSPSIQMVAMQYPMRKVNTLRDMVNDQYVLFIDNERNFKQAVKNSGYADYFQDNMAGDFGRTTDKGSRLLAENLANALIHYWQVTKNKDIVQN